MEQKRAVIQFEKVSHLRHYEIPRGMDVLHTGSYAILKEEKCMEYGMVVDIKPAGDETVYGVFQRGATEDDLEIIVKNRFLAKQALEQGNRQIEARDLPMHFFHARYCFDRTRLTFMFTAEDRVDFRELLKDLASMFKARIELRQVGAREETRVVGGFGPCGRRTCCSTFLIDLKPISIKMAREQGLTQTPNKVTGICGKLMCCLRYELEFYKQALAEFPPLHSVITVNDIQGTVVHQNALRQSVTLSLPGGIIREVPLRDIEPAAR